MPALRAEFADFGIDPRALDTMSLYEIFSMREALINRRKPGGEPTEADHDEVIERLRALNMPDVRV